MTTSASCSYFIQLRAAMLRMCLGCVICSLFFEIHAAHGAQPETDPFSPGFDLASIRLAHYDTADTAQPITDHFSARVGLADSASVRVGFGGTSSFPGYINLEKFTSWVASIRWHLTANAESSRASLSPQLRVESKETLVEVKPLDRSVWMIWHRALD
ncbi:MAG: hypothetical protein ACOY9D_08545 [Pseudomonadota bacterium]